MTESWVKLFADAGRRRRLRGRGDLQDRGDAAVDVGLVGRPVGDRDPHGRAAAPGGAGEEAGALVADLFDDPAGAGVVVAETHEHLVGHDVVEDGYVLGGAE